MPIAVEVGDTLVFQPENLPRLAARWNLELCFAAQGGHLNLSAQGGLNKADWQFVEDIILIPAEEFVFLD